MSDVVPHQYLSVKLKVERKTNQFELLGQVGLNGVLGSLHGLPKQPDRLVSELWLKKISQVNAQTMCRSQLVEC